MNYRQEASPETSLDNTTKKGRISPKDRKLLILVLVSTILLLYFMRPQRGRSSVQAESLHKEIELAEQEAVALEPTTQPMPEPTPCPAFVPDALQQLEEYAEAQRGQVSVWIRDLETGETYYHDEGGYYCASTLKAPYALWLCLKDERGEIDLDAELKGGTGWELLHDMIAQSSNSATRTLCAKWPGDAQNGFGELLQQIGFSFVDGCEISLDGIYGWVSAQDGGFAMQALYDYFETGTENAQKLKQAFLDADHDVLWSPSPAAKKYGSWDNAFHDMMIVYGDKPYILSVFSNWGIADVNFPEESAAMMQQMGKLAAAAVGATVTE